MLRKRAYVDESLHKVTTKPFIKEVEADRLGQNYGEPGTKSKPLFF